MAQYRNDAQVGNDTTDSPGHAVARRLPGGPAHDFSDVHFPNYRLIELLLESDAVSIYRGVRRDDGRRVVIKQPSDGRDAADLLLRCHHEFDLLAAIDDPLVVKAIEVVQQRDSAALVLEDFDGPALKHWIADGDESLAFRLDVAIRLASAVAAVHAAGIVHRNISSHNFLIEPATGEIRLASFSSARSMGESAVESDFPDVIHGDLAYISPEQTGRTNRRVDDRSDCYSLGMTLYELFTGQLPFAGKDGLEWVHFHLAGKTQPPTAIEPELPEALSSIVLRLLERDPEDRYQSAAGVVADLTTCAKQLRETGAIASFELGRHDAKERFDLPQSVFGREAETAALLDAFERSASGSTELVRVLGLQGSGKSSLVQQLHLPVTRRRGYFVTGSCRANTKDQVFGPIVAALGGLIRQILTESEQSIREWRDEIQQALGTNGRLIVDVLPELEHIVGRQPPVPPLPDDASRARFESTFAAFIRVFARNSHPLVLFLDDMQHADTGSRKLLRLLLSDPASESLLVVETYELAERSGLDDKSTLTSSLDSLPAPVTTIELDSLDADAVARLVGAALRQDARDVRPLAEVICAKTAGKPLYIRRFLQSLHDAGQIIFDAEASRFACDVQAAEEADITENVAQAMAAKLQTLGSPTPEALRIAAVIGRRFDLGVLAAVCNSTVVEVLELLKPAREAGYIVPVSEPGQRRSSDRSAPAAHWVYAFAHEHLLRAAYALSEPRELPGLHLAIGRALLLQCDEQQRDKRLLDIVSHLNHGSELMDSGAERIELAELNRRAGDRMRNTTAFEAAEVFYRAGIELLGPDPWHANRLLCLRLHSGLVNVMLQGGELTTALEIIDNALVHAESVRDRAHFGASRVRAHMRMNAPLAALESGVAMLRELRIELPESRDAIDRATSEELETIRNRFAATGIDGLLDLPRLHDMDRIGIMALMRHCLPAAFQTDLGLFGILCCRMVSMSLDEGNCRWSAGAYGSIAVLLSGELRSFDEADGFARLAIALGERFGDPSIFPEAAMLRTQFTLHWVEPIDESIAMFDACSSAALDMGDHAIATYSATRRLAHLAFRGWPLPRQRREAELAAELCRRIGDTSHVDIARCYLHAIDSMTAPTPEADTRLRVEEAALTQAIETQDNFSLRSEWQLLLLKNRYLLGDYDTAHRAAEACEELRSYSRAFITDTEYVFYTALNLAALYRDAGETERRAIASKINLLRRELRKHAAGCQQNRLHLSLLVHAECARLRGNTMRAMQLYDAAISHAVRYGYLHIEALAAELSSRFWLDEKKKDFARIYAERAMRAYEKFGATRKRTELGALVDSLQPRRKQRKPAVDRSAAATRPTDVDTLDLAAVIKASQVIAGEIVLEELLGKFLDIVLECAGGDRIALILPTEDSFLIQGIKNQPDQRPELMIRESVEASARLSKRIVNYVIRTQEYLVLSETENYGQFRADGYILNRRPKSVLCAPIMNKSELAGVIYIENTKISEAFTPGRLKALEILLSQIAISIENAELYARQEEQARNIERANTTLTTEIAERKRIEKQLSRYRDHLEDLVTQRTNELEMANRQLQAEAKGREEALEKLEKSNEQIRSLAYLDGLTGLPNRRLLKEHLDKILARCKRKGLEFAVLFVDLDNFKLINDSIGHQAADIILRDLAEALSDLIRAEDVLAMHMDSAIDLDATISISPITESVLSRLGGDEFVILLPEIRDRFAAATVAQRIIDRLERPFEVAGQDVFVAVSIGIATFPDDGQSAEKLLRNADTAMYHAKQLGKATYQYYSDEMNVASVERLTLESGLRKALDENRLELHYQPQVDIETGRIVGAEALIRWNDPVRGFISPSTFVPIAESGGLILQIGEWTLHEAARQAVEWRDQGLPFIPVSVNVSGMQFRRQDIAALVEETLERTGLDPAALGIEITETSLMSVLDRAAEVLRKLRDLGVATALDDFGTGYSSLGYLKAFPLDALKIDRSFIAGMLTDEKTAALTEAIVNITRILDLKVVAEGIENEAQLDYLRQLGCSTAQGYYFSPAVPAAEFARLLIAQPAHWVPGKPSKEDLRLG